MVNTPRKKSINHLIFGYIRRESGGCSVLFVTLCAKADEMNTSANDIPGLNSKIRVKRANLTQNF